MLVAYKYRLYPNKEQQEYFAKCFGCVRFIYNRMLSDKIEYYKDTKQKLNNTPAQYKKEFEWLKEVDSLALANAQMNLQTAYNNFFKRPEVGFPKFKSKKIIDILTLLIIKVEIFMCLIDILNCLRSD